MEETVTILLKELVTHDTMRLTVQRPGNYEFTPGQATYLSLDTPEWRRQKRPFTFTSLNSDPVLEFIIKCYPQHDGVTKRLHQLNPGDRVIVRDAWGAIAYRGPGTFIAGGTGITPFIAIFRSLQKEGRLVGNRLIFSNKTARDVILEQELRELFGDDITLILTAEKRDGYLSGRIDRSFLSEHIHDFSQYFYICGPPGFVMDITEHLENLGARTDRIVIEQ